MCLCLSNGMFIGVQYTITAYRLHCIPHGPYNPCAYVCKDTPQQYHKVDFTNLYSSDFPSSRDRRKRTIKLALAVSASSLSSAQNRVL